jgi:hypothetical protein
MAEAFIPQTQELPSFGNPYIRYAGQLIKEGVYWSIYTSSEPVLNGNGVNIAEAETTQRVVRNSSNTMFEHNGQNSGHLEVTRLFIEQWSLLQPLLFGIDRSDNQLKISDDSMYPEVYLECPYFNARTGHMIDCMGNDRHGHFYIFEIGRGHKTSQLERQLYLAHTLFPNSEIHGAVVKYKNTGEDSRRLFVRFID